MAFWIDPFLMIGFGIIIAWLTKRFAPGNPHAVYVLGTLTMIGTYFVAIGLFVNVSLFEPIWEFLLADTGTEFMINGVILPIAESGLVWQELSGTQMFISIFIFCTYPVFLVLGVVLGRNLFGRNPDQEGVVGLLRP